MTSSGKRRATDGAPGDRDEDMEMLEAADTLLEFSRKLHRLCHVKSSEEVPPRPHWLIKGKRSKRSHRREKSVLLSAFAIPLDFKVFRRDDLPQETMANKLDSLQTTELEEHANSPAVQCRKESFPSDSRAESPSSPLLSCQSECRPFLPGCVPADSAFQRIFPVYNLQKPSPVSSKIKVESNSCEVEYFSSLGMERSPKFGKLMLFTTRAMTTADTISTMSNELNCRSVIHSVSEDSAAVMSTPCFTLDRIANKHMKRSKPASTEIEKEARRLLRVQANRESARQTIRRKQVLCEELNQKAVIIKKENERLMQERELLLEKLYALSERNKQLKEQILLSHGAYLPERKIVPQQPVSLASLEGSTENGQQKVPYFLSSHSFTAQLATEQLFNVGGVKAAGSQFLDPMLEGNAIVKLGDKGHVQSGISSVHQNVVHSEPQCLQSSDGAQQNTLPLFENPRGTCKMESAAKELLHSDILVDTESQKYWCTNGSSALGYKAPEALEKSGTSFCKEKVQISRNPSSQHLLANPIKSLEQINSASGWKLLAAAEARRRRKELTRNKSLRFRQVKMPCRLSI